MLAAAPQWIPALLRLRSDRGAAERHQLPVANRRSAWWVRKISLAEKEGLLLGGKGKYLISSGYIRRLSWQSTLVDSRGIWPFWVIVVLWGSGADLFGLIVMESAGVCFRPIAAIRQPSCKRPLVLSMNGAKAIQVVCVSPLGLQDTPLLSDPDKA